MATTFTASRAALPQPGLWPGVFAQQEAKEVLLGERSCSLRAVVDEALGWLELSTDRGLVEREWERRFWGRCVTLLRLWSNEELREERVRLSPGVDGGWVELLRAGVRRSPAITAWDSMLPPGTLTLDTVAKALTLFDELAPVPDVASTHVSHRVTLELAVLANASALEGLHRGSHGGSVLFPAIKKPRPVAKAAAQTAADAAVEKGLLDKEDVQVAVERMTESFSFFNEPTFAERLKELLPPVEAVARGLIGADPDVWVSAVKRARNLEAHRLVRKPAQRENHKEHIDGYFELAASTEWVLRISLLLHFGVPGQLLHDRLLEHQRFLFALANMDHGEEPPGGRLEAFRASRKPADEAVNVEAPATPTG